MALVSWSEAGGNGPNTLWSRSSPIFRDGMRRHGLRAKIYPTVGGIGLLSGLAGALIAGIVKVDPKSLPTWMLFGKASLISIQSASWYLAPACVLLAGVCAAIRHYIGEPWVWGAIAHLMNTYRDFVFSDQEHENLHHHRVTLFRYYRWYEWPCCLRWPPGQRLIPVARSGHMTQSSKVAFAVPDSGDGAEGFAGKVWTTFSTLIINDLPDVQPGSDDATIRDYAIKTFCTEAWVRDRLARNLVMGRSFCGIPIRVKGREWGIIILDSRSPRALKRNAEPHYDVMGKALGKLLERV